MGSEFWDDVDAEIADLYAREQEDVENTEDTEDLEDLDLRLTDEQ